jgi:glycosyltransferase involved in cell wall biosynthesis
MDIRRVLIVAQPGTGGVARHIIDLVSHLDAADNDVEVACPRGTQLWEELQARRIPLRPFTAHRGPAISDLLWLLRLLVLVRHADIVHAHSSKAGVLVRLAAFLTGRRRRCLYTAHGWSFWSATGVMRRVYVLAERIAARWCQVVVAVSGFEAETGRSLGVLPRGRYEVVPNGIDIARFAQPRRPVPGRMVMVGRLAAPKRHDVAVRALQVLRATHPDAELHLVGDGPQRAQVVQLARDLGMEGAVRFLGDRSDVPDILAEASCAVLVSDYEGCPLAVLEAMAAGLPVVVNDAGGLDEVVRRGRTGFVVGTSPEEIAAAVGRLLDDPDHAATMGEAARQEALRSFSIQRMVDHTASIYDELVAVRPRVPVPAGRPDRAQRPSVAAA